LIVGDAVERAPVEWPHPGHERIHMQFPTYTKPLVWGFIGGAVACMIIGFSWGGWVTSSTAREHTTAVAHDAVVAALAPICAERFRTQSDGPAKIAELAKASSWERGSVVEKSGFALMPGGKTADMDVADVARACADILASPPVPKT
jgi:pimeloyl-ACP methyl ester carboxylesterase